MEPDDAFKRAKEEADKFVADRVATLNADPTALEAFQDRLYRMIDYGIKRFDWYEEQRFKFLQIALALITVTAGLSGFLANVRSSISPLALGLSFGAVVTLLFTGIKLMLAYNELRDITYPYTKIADIRSWFFRYNFKSLPAALSREPVQSIKEVQETATAYQKFVERWSEYAKKQKGFIEEDLQQVFILQVLQSYRRESLERMVKLLNVGVIVFVSFAALAVFVFFLQGHA
jgi:hypothetical protein